MSFDVIQLIPVGGTSTDSYLANVVGTIYRSPTNKVYRLVKAANAITTPRYKVVTSTVSSGALTWTCDVPSTAGALNVAGVIPSDYGTTTIAQNAYFWVQIVGPATVLAHHTLILGSGTASLKTATTGGRVRAITADGVGNPNITIGRALNTAVVTAAGNTIGAFLNLVA